MQKKIDEVMGLVKEAVFCAATAQLCESEHDDASASRYNQSSDAAYQAIRAKLLELLPVWQPIETFKKDIVYCDNKNCYSGYALVFDESMPLPVRARWWWRTDSDACNFLTDGSNVVFPSVWMPLPKAPE